MNSVGVSSGPLLSSPLFSSVRARPEYGPPGYIVESQTCTGTGEIEPEMKRHRKLTSYITTFNTQIKILTPMVWPAILLY